MSKRKLPEPTNRDPKLGDRSFKRVKTAPARTLLAQTSDQALNDRGELDVLSFVKAREYEIMALESGMAASKHAGTARVFQQVPRNMRRRTASHNVKKVPKRLRARAAKEVRSSSAMSNINVEH